MSERDVISDDEALLAEAEREIAAAVAPVVAGLAVTRARILAAEQIKRHDLVPRLTLTDQPTAAELLREALVALEAHARKPGATATGAHDQVRLVAVRMGVWGASKRTAFRRTRAEIEADRDAAFDRQRAAEGRQR